MEIEYAFLARYVEPAADGTLTITGGDLGTIRLRSFPGTSPALSVVVKFKPSEDGRLPKFRFRVRGPEPIGTVFYSGDGWQEIRGTRPKESNAAEGPRFVVSLPMLEFPGPGDYTAVVEIESGPTRELPLFVRNQEG
jgi:hypothetical protein